ncbi:uncharacterized protein LOC127122002 [Lathyrus oleraceus]|uniref:uncharacterized protein LOC127122002 n=1 Tax=Pisum sativum TaxID=3888 RepID=UPI0021D222F0|nr:uncharacterized protein LOC127122002 [Pisum sativum]
MDLIKYIFEKPVVTSRISRWKMLLNEYDIQHVTQKEIKGSVLSDYLTHLPVESYQPLRFDFLDEDIIFIIYFTIPGHEENPEEGPEPGLRCTLVFDSASNARGHGIGAIITSSTVFHGPFTARLCFDCTNNMAEYKACIYGMEAAIDLRIRILEVYGDSALVISQVKGNLETRDSKLIPYKEHIRKLMPYFNEISFHHIPREENQLANARAMLASMFKVKWKNEAPTIHIDPLDEPTHCLAIETNPDDNPWFYDIKIFLEKQQYPEGISITDKKALRRLSSMFFLNGCEGVHAKGPAMAKKILRAEYYWTTVKVDYYNFVRRYHKCQIYGDKIFVPPTPLNILTSPWPFSMWGIDMIRMIEPKASNGHRFILVAIDYFTKWVEAASYANVTRQVVTRFIKKEIIYCYGIPSKIIIDNASNLNSNMMKEFYKTSVRTSTRATPYSLVYGMEAVLPIEVEIPSLRVIMESYLDEAKWVQSRYNQLNLIEEKHLTDACHGQLYQRRLKRAFDKKVLPREYRSGELMLKWYSAIHSDPRGKWTPNYEGPFVIKKAFSGGAQILTTMDGEDLPSR